MIWNEHSRLKGEHAFLSASKYHWVNYDVDRLTHAYNKYKAAELGTRVHALARALIEQKQKLPRNNNALNRFVNDAIGFRMAPEQVLFYSVNSFGTADAICFRDNLLRIHDLKTGLVLASMIQLEIYAALFCLEYEKDPFNIGINLRIYQGVQVVESTPTPQLITNRMKTIVAFDQHIESIKLEEE